LDIDVECIAIRAGIAICGTCVGIVGGELLITKVVWCRQTGQLASEAGTVSSGRIRPSGS
jgi:hypothetical protein